MRQITVRRITALMLLRLAVEEFRRTLVPELEVGHAEPADAS